MKTFQENVNDLKRIRKALVKDMKATNKELEAFNQFVADFAQETTTMNYVVSNLLRKAKTNKRKK